MCIHTHICISKLLQKPTRTYFLASTLASASASWIPFLIVSTKTAACLQYKHIVRFTHSAVYFTIIKINHLYATYQSQSRRGNKKVSGNNLRWTDFLITSPTYVTHVRPPDTPITINHHYYFLSSLLPFKIHLYIWKGKAAILSCQIET